MILTISSSGQKNTKIKICIIGTKGRIDLTPKDMFNCFKSALKEFILSVQTKKSKISNRQILETVKLIELGR